MTLTTNQWNFINVVAELGTPKLAADQLRIDYSVYREWEEDREFRQEVRLAKDYFKDGINETLKVLAKRELLNIMMNGVTQLITTSEEVTDTEGNLLGIKRKITRKYLGKPQWAIKECIALIPQIDKLIEGLAANNALPAAKLEAAKRATVEYEQGLRELIYDDKGDNLVIDEEVIAGIQRSLLGGN